MDPGMGDAIKALATCWAMLALGNECFEAGGATFIRNPDIPGRRDANHVARVTASTEREMDRLLARAEIEFGRLLPSALRCGPYHPAHLPRPPCPLRLPAARRPCDDTHRRPGPPSRAPRHPSGGKRRRLGCAGGHLSARPSGVPA